mmetsp:Transcript_125608/g.268050  ORF Transcript_125608/g.268050 Transcript_125608/m.268050 type:complete len:283 (+) Transcript_125608:71-919(+)
MNGGLLSGVRAQEPAPLRCAPHLVLWRSIGRSLARRGLHRGGGVLPGEVSGACECQPRWWLLRPLGAEVQHQTLATEEEEELVVVGAAEKAEHELGRGADAWATGPTTLDSGEVVLLLDHLPRQVALLRPTRLLHLAAPFVGEVCGLRHTRRRGRNARRRLPPGLELLQPRLAGHLRVHAHAMLEAVVHEVRDHNGGRSLGEPHQGFEVHVAEDAASPAPAPAGETLDVKGVVHELHYLSDLLVKLWKVGHDPQLGVIAEDLQAFPVLLPGLLGRRVAPWVV